jgi:SNF2 family DNA or RNA helicase
MNNKNIQRENGKELYKALRITMENRTFLPLRTTTQLHPQQIVAVNWMVEKESSLEHGGQLADDCGTGKAIHLHSDNSAMLTITRL